MKIFDILVFPIKAVSDSSIFSIVQYKNKPIRPVLHDRCENQANANYVFR